MGRACPSCGAEADDGARFCSRCGTALAVAPGERKLATMVFADLVGSTRLAASLDPEELRRRIAPFFELASATMREHGGTVEKYIGDAVMAVFGVPVAHGDDPDRAVAAALALLDRVRERGNGLAVRIGIETGEVLALEPGGDLSVTGEAVNAAARLQAAAEANEVVVGERAARSCRRARLVPREPVEAKGFAAPLPAWRATGVAAIAEPSDAPFVGRADDLELLRLVYRRTVRERVPELVLITGEAGIGKTRMVAELVRSLSRDEPCPEVLQGRNLPYGRGIALWALAEIVRDAAGARSGDSVGDVRAALERRLGGLGAPDAAEVAASLAAVLGESEPDTDAEEALRRGWRRMIALLAAARPLIVVLDDAHWADDEVLELVEEVAFRLEDAPLLAICTARPEMLERHADFGRAGRNVTQIELRPLQLDAATEMAASLLPASAARLARRVAEASGGNPFFVEEIARSIVGEGGDARRLPDTVQAAISARLDLLPPAEKRTLQHAAVLGQRFTQELLAGLMGEEPTEALEALAQKALVQELLVSDPGRWNFRHTLIRDVAYSSLPRAERARLHERVAEALAAGAGERRGELDELVAFHRNEAFELEPSPERRQAALAATADAAAALFRRGATHRSQELYERAAELADSPQARLEALESAAGVALRRVRGDQAVRLLQAAAEVAEGAGNASAAAAAYARAAETATRMVGITGALPEAELRRMIERGEELAAQGPDPVTRARLVLARAWLAWSRSRLDEMGGAAEEALALARQLDDVPLLSSALDAAAATAWHGGRFQEALERTAERLRLLEGGVAGPLIESERDDALHMMAESLIQLGRYREARSYAERLRKSNVDRGIVYSGWARTIVPSFQLGEWDEALAAAKRVREAWTAVERPPSTFMGGAVAMAGAVLGYRGDMHGFEDWMGFAEEVAGRSGQKLGVITMRAEVALHQGNVADAAELLAGEDTGFLFWWKPAFFATRAEVLAAAGGGEAEAAIAAAEEHIGDSRPCAGVLWRARGRLSGDQADLRRALAIFEEIECPFQAARTGWLLGGEERARAERTFERLGATLPGVPAATGAR